jgi:[protein-PII] uridylyltransferase
MHETFHDYLSKFVASMPLEYRERYDARAIAEHAGFARARTGRVSVGTFQSPAHKGLPLCVVADDAPGLLSRISAALVLSKLDVIHAEAYCRELDTGIDEAVDLFWVRRFDDHREPAWLGPETVASFRSVLVVLMDGTFARDALVEHMLDAPESYGFAGTRLRFVYDDRGFIAALDVETADRPGLLFALSDALFAQRLMIVRSEIRTVGARVFDRFYFRELGGGPVSQERQAAIQAEVQAALRPPPRAGTGADKLGAAEFDTGLPRLTVSSFKNTP